VEQAMNRLQTPTPYADCINTHLPPESSDHGGYGLQAAACTYLPGKPNTSAVLHGDSTALGHICTKLAVGLTGSLSWDKSPLRQQGGSPG